MCTRVAAPRPFSSGSEDDPGALVNLHRRGRRLRRVPVGRHPEFHLEFLPAYSPNLNLIERLWKFLRKRAFTQWHKTFEDMEAAVSAVLDHLEDYRDELTTLMTEKFQSHPMRRL